MHSMGTNGRGLGRSLARRLLNLMTGRVASKVHSHKPARASRPTLCAAVWPLQQTPRPLSLLAICSIVRTSDVVTAVSSNSPWAAASEAARCRQPRCDGRKLVCWLQPGSQGLYAFTPVSFNVSCYSRQSEEQCCSLGAAVQQAPCPCIFAQAADPA